MRRLHAKLKGLRCCQAFSDLCDFPVHDLYCDVLLIIRYVVLGD